MPHAYALKRRYRERVVLRASLHVRRVFVLWQFSWGDEIRKESSVNWTGEVFESRSSANGLSPIALESQQHDHWANR
jgi:hypothetical protein